MIVYIYRITFESKDPVYRDLAIHSDTNLEDLHKAIISSFFINNTQMASFYKSNHNWEQGEEYTLLEKKESPYTFLMKGTKLKDLTSKKNDKLIYIFDFFLMWTFFIELIDINEKEYKDLPHIIESVGTMPENNINTNVNELNKKHYN